MATAWIDWMFPKSEDWVAPMHLHNDLLRPLVLRCIMMIIKMIQIKKIDDQNYQNFSLLLHIDAPLHSIIPFVSWRFAVCCCHRPYCHCFCLECRFGCCLCRCCVVLCCIWVLGSVLPHLVWTVSRLTATCAAPLILLGDGKGTHRTGFCCCCVFPPWGRKMYTLNRVLLLSVLVGVGDIIEKTIDHRYIGIFQVIDKLSLSKK